MVIIWLMYFNNEHYWFSDLSIGGLATTTILSHRDGLFKALRLAIHCSAMPIEP